MGVRLVLVLDLDGGEPDLVRAYGGELVEAIERHRDLGLPAMIEWRAEQLVEVRVEADEPS